MIRDLLSHISFRSQNVQLCFILLLSLSSICYATDATPGEAAPDLSRPDIIDPAVLTPNQDVSEEQAGKGHCRIGGAIYTHGQLIKTTLVCYKVRCGGGRLSWVPDNNCCVSSSALMPPATRETTPDVCQYRVCSQGRWTLRPDYDRCCQHEQKWYPVGSSLPMRGGPCTYQLCHTGRWEAHYNTSCCFDEIGWHTPGTVLFTSDPCRTKTCRDARWSEKDTCCRDSQSRRRVATGDIIPIDGCRYRICQENSWLTHTAFGCCERNGHQYEHGTFINVGGAWCGRDRCVDGAWHVVRRQNIGNAHCRRGWGRLGHRCVTVSPDKMTWREANMWCGSYGGFLLSILNRNGWKNAEKAGNATMWLGLRGYDFSSPSLEWRWVDGTPLTSHVLWARRHPQSMPGHVCSYLQHGRAYSATCDEKHQAYCATTECRSN